ncbi:MAG: hypothetical protein ACOYMG_01545 [Candidatus Methylumidiphilus sp.]
MNAIVHALHCYQNSPRYYATVPHHATITGLEAGFTHKSTNLVKLNAELCQVEEDFGVKGKSVILKEMSPRVVLRHYHSIFR